VTITFRVDESADVPLRDAATVVLARDGVDGLEVFMLKRNMNSDFVGGAYVFPGGGVDPEDRGDDLESLCVGRSDAEASVAVGVPSGGLAFWAAAIRESFEEAGVLLAYDASGEIVELDGDGDGEADARWAEHRRAVDTDERRLVEVCEAEGLRLAVDGMHYFANWVTPEGSPRRYDTYFFVAAAPPGQTPVHDDHEVIANEWVRPADGIARALAGELNLLPPTIGSLRAIEPFETVADLLAAAAAITEVPRIVPRIRVVGELVYLLLPGDPGFDGGPIDPSTDTQAWLHADGTRNTGFSTVETR
jgi:8-oxo-dGTP pyrophosphatase MutT (NUDIX family)